MGQNRYFITFSCYGSHLHGGAGGSVDRHHNVLGGRLVDSHELTEAVESELMGTPYELGGLARIWVLHAIKEVCEHRGWLLFAAHVRMTHVHAVIEADVLPELVMNALKAYASRRLNVEEGRRKRWTRHGSTRWLWTDGEVSGAVRYVVDGQGEAMAVFEREA